MEVNLGAAKQCSFTKRVTHDQIGQFWLGSLCAYALPCGQEIAILERRAELTWWFVWRSPKLEEVCYSSSCQDAVSETIRCLLGARRLRMLDITPRNMVLSPDQLHTLGLLPLTELRLNSYMYNQQPAINRASHSHLDNEGVRALVDSICHRVNARAGMLQQFRRADASGSAMMSRFMCMLQVILPIA